MPLVPGSLTGSETFLELSVRVTSLCLMCLLIVVMSRVSEGLKVLL